MYYIILDFEANTDEKKEIIEFPSVVVKDEEIIDQIQIYVKPTVPITEFCTELTGISNETVAEAPDFKTALKMYSTWLSQYLGQPFTFITDGAWDLDTCLPNQCKLSGIKIPGFFREPPINIKKLFKSHTHQRYTNIKSMLDYYGLEMHGRLHSGLDDCINIARVWIELSKNLS